MLGAKGGGIFEAIAELILRGIGRAIGKELGREYEPMVWFGVVLVGAICFVVIVERARRKTAAHHKKGK